jgi:hypothetical protein
MGVWDEEGMMHVGMWKRVEIAGLEERLTHKPLLLDSVER